jgi:hypothetical protein
MTSVPAEPARVAPPRPPRQPRGFITSYGVGRMCADPGCRTELSRYNKSQLCYPHAAALTSRPHRERS